MTTFRPIAHSPAQILRDLWTVAGGDAGRARTRHAHRRTSRRCRPRSASAPLAQADDRGGRRWPRPSSTGSAAARDQTVAVDMRHAAIEFRSERYMRIAGKPPASVWDKIAGVYRTGDGRYVRLHTNFPHHRDGMLKLLGCKLRARGRAGRALQVGGREIRDRRRRGRARRHHDALARGMGRPSRRARPSPSCRCSRSAASARPRPGRCRARASGRSSGIRVLDLTRVIAGPVCGRTLAAHGADVMRITAPHLPGLPELDIDTGRGKLAAVARPARRRGARAARRAAARGARVRAGLSPRRHRRVSASRPRPAPRCRPGIVAVSLSAYGHAGPWATRRGFDSLVQTASGLNHAEAEAAGVLPRPKELPAQALDHASGYLMAFGAMMALARKAREGGSWHVRVSLAQTGHWLRASAASRTASPAPIPSPPTSPTCSTRSTRPSAASPSCATPRRSRRRRPSGPARPCPLGTHAPVWPV